MVETAYPFDTGPGANVLETEWQRMARAWLDTGVIVAPPGRAGELAVTANGGAMQVSVAAGTAWVEGFLYDTDAALARPIGAADATNPRIDTVVVRLDRGANTMGVVVLQGTPAASPAAPALTQTDVLYELPLANVRVGAAVGVINAGDVTDRRVLVGPGYRKAEADRRFANLDEGPTFAGPVTAPTLAVDRTDPTFSRFRITHASANEAVLDLLSADEAAVQARLSFIDDATNRRIASNIRFIAPDVQAGQTRIQAEFIELAGERGTDGLTFLDWHSRAGVDFDSRLISFSEASGVAAIDVGVLRVEHGRPQGHLVDEGGFRSGRMQHYEAYDGALFALNNTAFQNGGPAVQFTAPPSGRVSIHWRSFIRSDVVNAYGVCAIQLIRSADGVNIFGPADEHAITVGAPDSKPEVAAGTSIVLGALTPRTDYTARLMFRTLNGQCSFARRQVIVVPSP